MTNRVSSGNLNTQPASSLRADQSPAQLRSPANFTADPVDDLTVDMTETSQSLLYDVDVDGNVEQEADFAESC